MQHIQQLTTTWLRPPRTARVGPPQAAPPIELPDRKRVRRVAQLYHRQLLAAKQESATRYFRVLREQMEELRQFTLELTPEQAHVFMNTYTEESSAVEREWEARKSKFELKQPIPPSLVRILVFAVTVFAIAMAITYAV